MLCLNCLKNDLADTDVCGCGSKNLVKKKGRKYLYLGQVYSEKKWLALMAGPKGYKINPLYLEKLFLKNVRIHTLIRLFLPSLFFLLLSLGLIWFMLIEQAWLDLHPNSIVFARFIALFLFVMALINFKRLFFDKIKVLAILRNKRIIYQQINANRYQNVINGYKSREEL